MAPSPQHSLDRIDNDRGYEPGNVRWADHKTQANNQRGSRICAVIAELGISEQQAIEILKRTL